MFRKVAILIDPEEKSIRHFIQCNAKKTKSGSYILDAGAGTKPYQKYFEHTYYESTDFGEIFDKSFIGSHTFISDLSTIPRSDFYYDVILCTQVLEHVKYPAVTLKEFHRILKPGGVILLTVPQGWGVHGEPYHFFNFTKYGIELLANDAGFTVQYMEERGGMFNYLAKRIMTLPAYIFGQYRVKLKRRNMLFLVFPFYFILKLLLEVLVPIVLICLDKLDKKRDYTLGYEVILVKKDR